MRNTSTASGDSSTVKFDTKLVLEFKVTALCCQRLPNLLGELNFIARSELHEELVRDL
jgi:hypothetical protein